MIKELQRTPPRTWRRRIWLGAQAQATGRGQESGWRVHRLHGDEHAQQAAGSTRAALPDGRAAATAARRAGSAERGRGRTCGATATGHRPEVARRSLKPFVEGWTCACARSTPANSARVRREAAPRGAPVYCCDKCGWKPADPAHPPKFARSAATCFDENDRA